MSGMLRTYNVGAGKGGLMRGQHRCLAYLGTYILNTPVNEGSRDGEIRTFLLFSVLGDVMRVLVGGRLAVLPAGWIPPAMWWKKA